jgi:hypothetical protein
MQYYKIVEWKLRLMRKLNDGILNTEEWQRFIAAAQANGFEAIAEDMRKRGRHYICAAEWQESPFAPLRKLEKSAK